MGRNPSMTICLLCEARRCDIAIYEPLNWAGNFSVVASSVALPRVVWPAFNWRHAFRFYESRELAFAFAVLRGHASSFSQLRRQFRRAILRRFFRALLSSA
jgi:hypothetical protein